MIETHTIPLIAPTASGQTDLTAVLVTEYGPLQGHASPVIRRQEVSRYHRLDPSHIRVREVSGSLSEPVRVSLEVDDENWTKVLKYVIANKEKGMDALLKQLRTKYKVSAPVQKALKENL